MKKLLAFIFSFVSLSGIFLSSTTAEACSHHSSEYSGLPAGKEIMEYIKGQYEDYHDKYFLYEFMKNHLDYSYSNVYETAFTPTSVSKVHRINQENYGRHIVSDFTFKKGYTYMLKMVGITKENKADFGMWYDHIYEVYNTDNHRDYCYYYTMEESDFKYYYSGYSVDYRDDEDPRSEKVAKDFEYRFKQLFDVDTMMYSEAIKKTSNFNDLCVPKNDEYSDTFLIGYYGDCYFFIPKKDFAISYNNLENLFTDFIFSDYKSVFSYIFEYEIINDWVAPGSDLKAPTINGSTFVVNVNNMLSLDTILSHFKAVDDTDKKPRVVLKSTNYEQSNRKVGDYNLVLYAEDSSGNRSQDYTFTIKVVDIDAPTITSTNIETGNSSCLTQEEIIKKFVIRDNYYSDTSDFTITVVKDEYTNNYRVPGTYKFTIKVKDKSNNTSSDATLNILVKDTTAPSIRPNAESKTQPNNAKLSQEDLLNLFTASDDVRIASKKIIADEYSGKYNVPGTYTVTCEVADEAGNKSTASIQIIVEDKTAPTITGSTVNKSYTEKFTDLRSLFTFSDDISQLGNITFKITTDNYTAKYNIKGTYTITASVTDEAGNTSTATATIIVEDKIAPQIVVAETINQSNAELLTEDLLKAKITVNDGYDGKISFEIKDLNSYFRNYKLVGKYKFEIVATDSSGNTATATFYINVTDGTAPELYVDSFVIVLQSGDTLTDDMIREYASKALEIEPSMILDIVGEYDTTKAGKYNITVILKDGSTRTATININKAKEEVAEFKFTDLFTADYWTKTFNYCNSNWFNFNSWNWMNWAFTVVAAIILLSLVNAFIKRKK